MRLIAVLTALFLGLAAPLAAEVPVPANRAETLILLHDALQAAEPGWELRLDMADESLGVFVDGTQVTTHYPDNLDLLLRQAGGAEERAAILADFVGVAQEAVTSLLATENAPIDPAQVLPVVRHREVLEAFGGTEMPLRPLAGDLVVLWVADGPTSYEMLTSKRVEEAGIAAGDLEDLGLRNLMARLATLEHQAAGPGLTLLVLDGFSESSALLVPDIWQKAAAGMERLVVAVPSRSFVVYGDASDPYVLAVLRGVAAVEEAYPLTDDLLEWTDAGWRVFGE